MKKFGTLLIAACVVSFIASAKTFAEETYSETLLNSLHQNINKTAAPIVNKERELNAKQKAAQDLQQQQITARRNQIQAQQDAQQALINKKKQQVQSQKDLLEQQKNGLKNIFSVQ